MVLKKSISGIVIGMVLGFITYAQGNPVQLFENYLESIKTQSFITTDRPWYFNNDSIWFSVSLLNEDDRISGSTLFIDIADSSGKIIHKEKFLFYDNATVSGMLKPSIPIKSGWYSIRASIAQAESESALAEMPVYIASKNEIPVQYKIRNKNLTGRAINFFAEGGSFINSVSTRIVITAKDDEGLPANVKGVIFKDDTDSLVLFATDNSGTASFLLDPFYRRRISAKIVWPDGITTVQSLPEFLAEGISLNASISNEKMFFKIEASEEIAKEAGKLLLLVSMQHKIIYQKNIGKLDSLQKFISNVSLGNIPEGIITLVVYAENGKRMAMRKVYHYTGKLNPVISADQLNFDPKAKNKITIQLPDSINALLSVSVTDADLSLPPASFDNAGVSFAQNDNLMIAETFNSPVFPLNISDTAFASSFSPEYGLNLKAKLPDNIKKIGKDKKVVTIFPESKYSDFFILTDTVSENGEFGFANIIFFDTTCFYLKLNNHKEKINVEILPAYFDMLNRRESLFDSVQLLPVDNSAVISNYTFRQYQKLDSATEKKAMLKEVTIYAKQRTRVDELDRNYASASLFGGRLGYVNAYDMEEEKGYYPNIISFLLTRVPNLTATGRPDAPVLKYRYRGSGTNVALFVNNSRLEIDFVASLPVSEIAYVKVFRPPFSYQLVTDNSSLVIVIYTFKGAKKNLTEPDTKGLSSFCTAGYSRSVLFHHINHSISSSTEGLPDKRVTLYWNPALQLLKGNGVIEFYNNDFSKRFRVTITGLSEKGEMIKYEKIISR